MLKIKEIDWSYKSLLRYIVDIHIFLLLAMIVGDYLEGLVGHEVVKQIILIWFAVFGLYLLGRAIDFIYQESIDIKEDTSTKLKESEKKDLTSIEIELDSDTQRALVKYIYENDLSISELMHLALEEYVKKHKKHKKVKDESSSDTTVVRETIVKEDSHE